MRRVLLLIAAGLVLTACTSEFYKHDSLFKTNEHVAYSWWGYKNTTAAEAKMSAEQGWWGKAIPYVPAK